LRLLLDTHAFLWWWADDKRLPKRTRATIADAETVWVSAASAWEIAIKMGLGKLRFEGRVADAVEDSGFERLPVGFEHAEAVHALPLHHHDPFDRLLLAQALVESATLVTRDPAFSAYGIALLWG
jgi:PIN domain nuclease of toxin-antitoxin system